MRSLIYLLVISFLIIGFVSAQDIEIFGMNKKDTGIIDLSVVPDIVREFLDLRDTPSSYSGNADRCVIVSGTEDSLIFTACNTTASNSSDFWDDLDSPANINFGDLLDVVLTSPATNTFLQFDGGNWIDFALLATANTWTATQRISGTNKWEFNDATNFIQADGSNRLVLSSGSFIEFAVGTTNWRLSEITDGVRFGLLGLGDDTFEFGAHIIPPFGSDNSLGNSSSPFTNLSLSGSVLVDNDCGVASGMLNFEERTVVSNTQWDMGGSISEESPQACPGIITAMAGYCSNTGTSLSIDITVNGSVKGSSLALLTSSGVVFNNPDFRFKEKDKLGITSLTEIGSWSSCGGTLWVRYD